MDGNDVDPGAFANRACGIGGHDPELRPRFDGEHLHLEPRAETRFVGEQIGDLGEGVPRDHGRAWAAMSRR